MPNRVYSLTASYSPQTYLKSRIIKYFLCKYAYTTHTMNTRIRHNMTQYDILTSLNDNPYSFISEHPFLFY